MILIHAILGILLSAALAFSWSGRNQRLRDIPDRTWLLVGKYNGASPTIGGSSEVPWAYDANSRVFVRVGGCTGGYTNAIVLYDLGTETTTTPFGVWDNSGPADRPGVGCNRGICYDPITKCIFEVGGGGATQIGPYGYWYGDMAARTWTNYRPSTLIQGQALCAADTETHVIVNTYRNGISTLRSCVLYYPDGDSLVNAPIRPGSTATSGYISHDWWPTMEYAPGLHGTMYFGYMWKDSAWGYAAQQWFTWLFDARTRTWRDLKPAGLEGVPATYVSQGPRPVLSWDNKANVMLLHIASLGLYVYHVERNAWEKVAETNPQHLSSQMFDYDDEHNVHVLVDYNFNYDQDIWAFRYSNTGSAAAQKSGVLSVAVPVLSCSPNPFRSGLSVNFQLNEPSSVRLSVYSAQGRLVERLCKGSQPAGAHSLVWDGKSAGPGLYAVRLEIGERTLSRIVVKDR